MGQELGLCLVFTLCGPLLLQEAGKIAQSHRIASATGGRHRWSVSCHTEHSGTLR